MSQVFQIGIALHETRERFGDMLAFQTFYKSQLCDDFLCAVMSTCPNISWQTNFAWQALDYFAALLKTMERKDSSARNDEESFVLTTEEEKASSILDQTMREVSTTVNHKQRSKTGNSLRFSTPSFPAYVVLPFRLKTGIRLAGCEVKAEDICEQLNDRRRARTNFPN
eukprot:762556-Hanusia_phi.AAC.9